VLCKIQNFTDGPGSFHHQMIIGLTTLVLRK